MLGGCGAVPLRPQKLAPNDKSAAAWAPTVAGRRGPLHAGEPVRVQPCGWIAAAGGGRRGSMAAAGLPPSDREGRAGLEAELGEGLNQLRRDVLQPS